MITRACASSAAWWPICRPVVERAVDVGAAAPISRAVDTPVKVSRRGSVSLVHGVNWLRFDGPFRQPVRLWGWSFRPLGWYPFRYGRKLLQCSARRRRG